MEETWEHATVHWHYHVYMIYDIHNEEIILTMSDLLTNWLEKIVKECTNIQEQVVNLRYQTPQEHPVTKPKTPLHILSLLGM